MLREMGKQAHNMAEIELDTTYCSTSGQFAYLEY